MSAYRALLDLTPDDAQAKQAVEELLEKIAGTGDVESLISSATSTEEKVALLQAEIAALEQAEADAQDRDTLWALYERLDELQAPSVDWLERQKALAAQLGRWESLARLCERQAALLEADPVRQCEQRFQRAELLRTRLGNAEEAGLLYLRLLSIEGTSPRMVEALEALFDAGVLKEAIAEALLSHYRRTGEASRAIEALKTLAAAARDPGTRRDFFVELAAISERTKGRERAALTWLDKALRLTPADAALRERIETLAQTLGAQAELASLYIELAREAGGTLAKALLLQAARLAAEVQEYDLALQALDLILNKAPDAEALDLLRQFARQADRPAEQAKALRGLIALLRETAEGEEEAAGVAALRLELIDLSERHDKVEVAAQLLEEHLEKCATPTAELFERLERLCLKIGDKAGAQRALTRQFELAEAAGDRALVARLRLRLSRLIADEAEGGGDASGALKNYAKILADRPKDPEALAALEKMLEVPERRQGAARVLDVAYQTTRDHHRQVHVLEIMAECATDPAEKIQILRRAAQIHAVELQQPELAFATLARALPLAPEDAQLRIATRKLAESAETLESYAEILEEAVEVTPGSRGVPLLRELADVCEKKLGQRDQALACFERIAAVEPENVEALRGMRRLYRLLDRPADLARATVLLGRLVFEDQERAMFWREAGALYEETLDDPEAAAASYRALAESDPLDRDAALALERLYAQLQEPEQLAFALELRRAQEGDSVVGRQAAFRLAELKRVLLKDPQGALALYQRILQGDPSHAETLEALEAWGMAATRGSVEALAIVDPILAQAGAHDRRIALREALLASLPTSQKPRLAAEIRAIHEIDRQQPDQAFMAACHHFSQGIDREGVLAELERLARGTDNLEIFADICEDSIDAVGLGDELKLKLLRRAAALRETLDEAEAAIALHQRVLQEIPGDKTAFNALARLHSKTADAASLAEVYLQQLTQVQAPEERKVLLLQAAATLFDAGRFAESVEQARAVLVLDAKSLDALRLLERAYGKLGEWRAQADALKSQCDLLPTQPERERAAFARAQLLDEKGEPAEAIEAFSQLLRENPGDQRAVTALERLFEKERTRPLAARVLEAHYRASDDARRLCDVLEVKATLSSRQERIDVLLELARLREGLGEKPLAFATLLRALGEDASDAAMLDALERLAADTGAFEELAAAYEDALERGPDEAVALSLLRRLGALYTERLPDLERAAQAYELVSAAQPNDAELLDVLARLYRRSNQPGPLVAVLWRQRDRAETAAQRQAILMEIAQCADAKLGDPETAIEALRGVLEIAPKDTQAQGQLERLLETTERYAELAELIEMNVERAEQQGKQEQALELRVTLGRLKRTQLADPRGALSLFSSVLFKRPGHPGAIAELEQMAESEGTLRAEAALALEPIFATSGDNLKLVQMLEARAQTAPQEEKAALLRRIAQIYEGPLENVDMAFVYAGRALEASPDDVEILADAHRSAVASGNQEELITLIEEITPRARTDAARVALVRLLATLQAQDGSLEDEAILSFRRLIELVPGDEAALDGLALLYRKRSAFGDLIDVLRLKLAVTEDPKACAELLRAMADLQISSLGDIDSAIASLRRLLEFSPEDMAALERLEHLCAEAERHAELADVLAREIALNLQRGLRERALGLKLRLAVLRDEKLLDRAGALALFEEILKERPGHSEAIACLEKTVERDFGFEAAGDLLTDALRQTGQHQKLANLLEERAAAIGGTRRLDFLVESAKLRIRFGRHDLAFLSLCRALREDPTQAEVRALLYQSAAQAETFEELAELYLEVLVRLDGDDALQVGLELGALYDERLGEPELAIEAYEKARLAEPAPGCRALEALCRLYEAGEAYEKLVDTLEALAATVESDEARADHLFRLGQVAELELDPPAPDRAARAYEQALELSPSHLPSARALAALYEAARRFDRLMAVLELERPLVSGSELDNLLGHMAEVALDGLDDPERAIELYVELRALNPRSEKAYAALERLYEETRKFEPLVELIQKRISQTVDPRELTRLFDKKGRALVELGRADEAIKDFRAALDRDPRHRPALDALRAIYEGQGPSEELAALLRRLIPLQDGVPAVKAVRLRFAEVLAAIGKRIESLDAARRALDLEPHTLDELLRVGDLFQTLESPADQIRALELRAMLLIEEDQEEGALEIFYAIADLQTDALKKPLAAASSYERVLDLDPTSRAAFDKLCEIYSALKEWRKLSAACERYLAALTEPEERLTLHKALAALQEEKLGQKDVAFLTYGRAFSEAPHDEDVRRAVHRIADETASHDELAAIYEEIVDSIERGPLFVELTLAFARLQDEKLDDPDAAEAQLRRVIEFDPASAEALEALASMFARRGRDTDYVGSLEQKYEVAASIEERKQLLREIALTQENRIGDMEEAAHAHQRALELEPDRETFRALVELYRRHKLPERCVEILERARDFETDPHERAQLQVELSEIQEREIGDSLEAITGFRLALEFEPGNRDALAALERIFTKLDRAAELLEIYRAQLALESPEGAIHLHFKSAAIWEGKLQNLERADQCLLEVLELDPTNLQAVRGLEKLRRLDAEARRPETERWEDLLQAYEYHLGLEPPVHDRVELFVAMGEVQRTELGWTAQAFDSFHKALELSPLSKEAMHALGLLYEEAGDAQNALDMLAKENELCGKTRESATLLCRMGAIHLDMLGAPQEAKAAFRKALEADPDALPAIRALQKLYEAEEDWDRCLDMIVQETQSATDMGERVDAHVRAANFLQEMREDTTSAALHYEKALELAPDLLDAARPLSDICMAEQRWERAEQLLDIVVQGLSNALSRDPKLAGQLCRQFYRLGYVCEKLGKDGRALSSYERAYQFDSTYLPSSEGYANRLVAAERLADAISVYQAILIHHSETLSELEVVEIYWQLGDLYQKLGQPDRAQREFERALSHDAHHDPSLRSMAALCEQLEHWEQALRYLERVAKLLDGSGEDGRAERFDVLLRAGLLAKDRLKDPYRAIETLTQAREIDPSSQKVLDLLLVLYIETRQSDRAVETLERLIALIDPAQAPTRACRFYCALGEVCRDALKDIERAAEAFNAALDIDYRFVQAFAALEAMLGEAGKWDLLEANYQRMLQRLPKLPETHEARMAIFRALANFYEQVKRDQVATLQIYQLLARGLPNDGEILEKYAQLAAAAPGQELMARDAYRDALPFSTSPQRVVQAIAQLSARARDYDGAWVAAQVAQHLLGEAGADEREILTKLSPYAQRREQVRRPVSEQLWARIYHPKLLSPMGGLLALLYNQLGAFFAKRHATFSIDPRLDRVDLTGQEFALNNFRYVRQLCGMSDTELYAPYLVALRDRMKKGAHAMQQFTHPEKGLLLEMVHVHPIALKAGGALFSETDQKTLNFHMVREMTFCRPELVLARMLPIARLEAVFQAALYYSVPGFTPTADLRAIETEGRILARLGQQFLGALGQLGQQYLQSAAADDLRGYIEATELTANRAATLLCSDIRVAMELMSKDPISRVPLRARVRDLLLFCTSANYAQLRAELGLSLEVRLS
ncbi:MAG: gliding motility protein [Myxococcales bacterium]|nr:gliding motility protein [Myxococcales bacterium]